MMKMKKSLLLLFVTLLTIINPTNAQTTPSCTNYVFKPTSAITQDNVPTTTPTYKTCVDLPVLNSFLHYNYHPTTSTLDIVYRHTGLDPATPMWVAWAINPTGKGMVGSQALIAYQNPKDGSMVVYTSSIASYGTQMAKTELSINVTELSAVSANNEIIIFATLKLPGNLTMVNQVWQDGPLSEDGRPMMHSISGPNLRSMASLDLLSGVAAAVKSVGGASARLKNIHGILNAVSWGILMPIGVLTARYMKVLPSPVWFYLHVGCQLSGYALGVAGWATGMKLGSASRGVAHPVHRNIGIALFSLATIQILALFLRPNKDHKNRFYWNVYHHSFGYTIIILSIINVFEGFKILEPKNIWKISYIGVIVGLGAIAVLLEVVTWYVVLKRRKVGANQDGSLDNA